MKTLSSRRNPIVDEYRRLAQRRDRANAEVLLDGIHLIDEALTAGVRLKHVAVTAELLESDRTAASIVRTLEAKNVPVAVVSASVMAAVSPVRSPAGMTAIGIREADTVEHALDGGGLVLVPVGIQDPGNLGAILRAAEAGGASGAISAGGADPFGWKALRGAMGSGLRLRVAESSDVESILREARQRSMQVVAASAHAGVSLFEVRFAAAAVVLLGSEGGGLDESLAKQADTTLHIPMRPPVESLNVAVSAGLIVYEAYRQRHEAR